MRYGTRRWAHEQTGKDAIRAALAGVAAAIVGDQTIPPERKRSSLAGLVEFEKKHLNGGIGTGAGNGNGNGEEPPMLTQGATRDEVESWWRVGSSGRPRAGGVPRLTAGSSRSAVKAYYTGESRGPRPGPAPAAARIRHLPPGCVPTTAAYTRDELRHHYLYEGGSDIARMARSLCSGVGASF